MSRQKVASAFAAALISTMLFANTASNASAAPLIVTGQLEPAPTRTVHHGDLDLASADGRQTLTRRVRGAVRSLCGVKPASPLSEAIIHRDCATSAWNSARPQINAAIDGRGLAARSGGIVVAALR